MARRSADTTAWAIKAGLLTWLIPGLGHYVLGHRGLAAVFFVAITLPYGVGIAVGGVLDSVNPRTNGWLLLAEIGIGGYTVPCYLASQSIESSVLKEVGLRAIPVPPPGRPPGEDYKRFIAARARYMSFYPGSDVAQIYLAAAGLLNLLAILDAIARAQTGGLPTYHRELTAAVGEGPG